MINSMTGFGSADGMSGKTALRIELKSVNNRFLDCSVKLPRSCSCVEDSVKKIIQSRVSRGKVDVFLTVDSSQEDEVEVRLNAPLLRAYQCAVREMQTEFGISDTMGTADYSRIPDIFSLQKKEVDAEALTKDVVAVTVAAVDLFCDMRAKEGRRLAEDITQKLDELEAMRQQVERRSPETVTAYREKLRARMEEVLASASVDESRILTEAAIYADKVAVDEELVRLKSHILQFRELLEASEPVGRKLDFLVQEMNREVNTTGSKCLDIDISKIVMDMKACLEKIREQVQNIE